MAKNWYLCVSSAIAKPSEYVPRRASPMTIWCISSPSRFIPCILP